ncbi:MAG: NAD+ synthase [Burkholderiaceae bacterium]
MRVALAQLNQTVGDFTGNAARIIEAAEQAAEEGAVVVVTPELSLTGYPPEDLLLRRGFYAKCDETMDHIRERTAALDVFLIIGLPILEGKLRYNAAQVLHKGEIVGEYRKHDLPNYDVFDEQRYFEPSATPLVFEAAGVRFGVLICEDCWFEYAPFASKAAGAQVILALNASPYHLDKQHLRIDIARRHITPLGVPVLSVNQVGGQDELVFDGVSFALDARGEILAQAKSFEPDLLTVNFHLNDSQVRFDKSRIEPTLSLEAQVYQTLVLGVRDYLGKNGFPGALLGLSGGIDSALTLAVAVDAIGAENVRAIMMPSRYTADMSLDDAAEMASKLNVRYDVLPIGPAFQAFTETLAEEFEGQPEDTTEENIQARIRGVLLMALSNKYGSIVLTTGNKSELAVGYCTLYGDMAGGFAVIKDLAKTLVYRLSSWRNQQPGGLVIPERIITRPPSAELREDQTDQDSLPDYDVLDGILQMYMEQNCSVSEILAAGYAEADVRQVVRLIRINEYKRRQAPVGIRVTHRAFGRDWRYPITSKYGE